MHYSFFGFLSVFLISIVDSLEKKEENLVLKNPYGPSSKIDPYIKLNVKQDANYEITAAGGSGGGNEFGSEGRAGLIQCTIKLKANDKLIIVVGSQGETSGQNCAGAGGGGASIIYKKRPRKSVIYDLILLAPGGGGAGRSLEPNSPDEYELNLPKVGKCNATNATAAPGRDYLLSVSDITNVNFSYAESEVPVNFTGPKGCKGGFGGGGQGGYGLVITKPSTYGGGGGGGGFKGGLVSPVGETVNGSCVAGGPGKPYCNAGYLDVKCGNPTSHRLNNGYIKFEIHELYKELPKLDRINYEKPAVDTTRKNSISNKASLWLIVCSIISRVICNPRYTPT